MNVAYAAPPGMWHRAANVLYLHPRALLFLLLTPPLLWLGIIYLGSLFALLAQSFFYIDEYSGLVVREFSFITWKTMTNGASNSSLAANV